MKNITYKSNFGRFATEITCTIGDDVNDETTALCVSGLSNELFRLGGSAGEKALVKAGGTHDGYERNGKAFPAGPVDKDTPRGAIPFTDARADVLEQAIQTALTEARAKAVKEEKSPLPAMTVTVTGEHEFGIVESPMKRATNFVDSIWADEAQRGLMLGLLKLPADATATQAVEAAHAMKLGIDSPKKSKK